MTIICKSTMQAYMLCAGAATRRAIMICAVLVACIAGSITPAVAQQDQWVGDVPIMSGLTIEPELGFAFDSPSGRIVMIFASTKRTAADFHNFYNVALANLGWSGGNGQWQRGSEKLSIEQVQTAVGMLWRIMIRPG